jgi:hypothetical protein
MDAHDRCTNLEKKNLGDSVAIYGQGREIFRPPIRMTGKIKATMYLTDVFKQFNKSQNKEQNIPLTYMYNITHKLNVDSAEYLTDHYHKLLQAVGDLTHCCTYCITVHVYIQGINSIVLH